MKLKEIDWNGKTGFILCLILNGAAAVAFLVDGNYYAALWATLVIVWSYNSWNWQLLTQDLLETLKISSQGVELLMKDVEKRDDYIRQLEKKLAQSGFVNAPTVGVMQ